MLVNTFNQKGEKVGQTRLPSEIFGLKLNPDLVHQVAVAQAANRRKVIAHTKTRAEVRGGGRKPWRQKGTGRARHGSIRSPLWIGGGVTFGPRNTRNFKQKINKKMRRKALFMVLSAKAKDGELIVLDDLKLEQPKTKLMAQVLQSLLVPRSRGDLDSGPKGIGMGSPSCILALAGYDQNLIRASRNIPKIRPMQAKDLNVLDLLSYKYLLMTKETIKTIKKTFVK